MKIAIDARDLANVTTGVGRYLLNLLNHFAELRPEFQFQLYSDRPLTTAFENSNVNARLLKGHKLLWKHLVMPLEQIRAGIDVFFVPSYSTPLWNPAQSVVTIHDLIYTRFPQWTDRVERWRFATIVRFSARFAAKIIAVSEATRKDILDLTGVSPHKVQVIYEGVDAIFRRLPEESINQVKNRLHLDRPFILYVGSMHYRRNVQRLLQAFSILKRDRKIPQQLLLCGLNLYRGSELETWVARERLEQDVRYIGYVSDEELVALYNMAEVFVYPSMYEGFGLPILEAMACGAPVVTCNVSALPEVAGNAALLIDPHDTQALVEALWRVLSEPNLKQELTGRGFEQSRKFSWKKAAQETLELFESTLT